jgi:hypothetical protein
MEVRYTVITSLKSAWFHICGCRAKLRVTAWKQVEGDTIQILLVIKAFIQFCVHVYYVYTAYTGGPG